MRSADHFNEQHVVVLDHTRDFLVVNRRELGPEEYLYKLGLACLQGAIVAAKTKCTAVVVNIELRIIFNIYRLNFVAYIFGCLLPGSQASLASS